METRRNKGIDKDEDLTLQQINEMTENELEHRHLNWFCVYCWQRYQKHTAHSSKICRDGRVLRRLATFSHHNNGEQLEAGAILD